MWTSPDDQYKNQIDYILCNQKWRSSILSEKKQDMELILAPYCKIQALIEDSRGNHQAIHV